VDPQLVDPPMPRECQDNPATLSRNWANQLHRVVTDRDKTRGAERGLKRPLRRRSGCRCFVGSARGLTRLFCAWAIESHSSTGNTLLPSP